MNSCARYIGPTGSVRIAIHLCETCARRSLSRGIPDSDSHRKKRRREPRRGRHECPRYIYQPVRREHRISYLIARVTGALSNPATVTTSGTALPGVMPLGMNAFT
jgi:hypothetical protein